MSRFLMIDIGAGTMDILCFDSSSGEHFKAVAMSPVRHVALHITHTQGPLAVSGAEMGGGPVTEVLKQRARQNEVVISPAAAATLHHDPDRVRNWGFNISDDSQIQQLVADGTHTAVTLGDVEPQRITSIVEGVGLSMDFEAVVLCAQDHGVAPAGVSHLDFRHNLFQQMLNNDPVPASLLFRSDEIPSAFNRLTCIAQTARQLNAREIYVMDSGMAAMTGAAQDAQAHKKAPIAILDVATSHTVVATLEGDQVAGVVEYHTRDITLERVEQLIYALADGQIAHERIIAEGGHGAYLRKAVGFANLKAIIVTGPKRRLMAASRLPIQWGAPWGDNMMTGTVGMLEAVRRRKSLPSITYI